MTKNMRSKMVKKLVSLKMSKMESEQIKQTRVQKRGKEKHKQREDTVLREYER